MDHEEHKDAQDKKEETEHLEKQQQSDYVFEDERHDKIDQMANKCSRELKARI